MIQREPASAANGAGERRVVLFVGPTGQKSLEATAPASLGTGLDLIALPDAIAAVAWIENERIEPVLIVVCQAWPGEVSNQNVALLRRVAPLARVCALSASWCEGETRSGRPSPGVWRVYSHQWPQRGVRELVALAGGQPSVWSLPATATAEEQVLREIDLVNRRAAATETAAGQRRGTVAIVAASTEARAALADACRSLGYEAIGWRGPPTGSTFQPALLLWDTSADQAASVAAVERLKAAASGAPIVALLGFPRPGQIQQARLAGVAAVLSKPFLLADLQWQLAAATG